MGVKSGAAVEQYRMVGGTTGGNWKRPVNRMYSYNYQVGENYYLPMTSYLETKTGQEVKIDLPGPLSFSERIAVNALNDIPKQPDCNAHKLLTRVRKLLSAEPTPNSE